MYYIALLPSYYSYMCVRIVYNTLPCDIREIQSYYCFNIKIKKLVILYVNN